MQQKPATNSMQKPAALPSKSYAATPESNIVTHPIISLTPYQTSNVTDVSHSPRSIGHSRLDHFRWTVKVRVTNKPNIQTWSKALRSFFRCRRSRRIRAEDQVCCSWQTHQRRPVDITTVAAQVAVSALYSPEMQLTEVSSSSTANASKVKSQPRPTTPVMHCDITYSHSCQ